MNVADAINCLLLAALVGTTIIYAGEAHRSRVAMEEQRYSSAMPIMVADVPLKQPSDKGQEGILVYLSNIVAQVLRWISGQLWLMPIPV